MIRTLATSCLTLLTLLALAAPVAAGGGGGGDVCRGFSEGERLVLRDSCFDGVGHLTGTATALTIVNEGQQPHTFTAVDGSFDSGTLPPGGSFELLLEEPGTTAVYCTLHANREGDGMAGRLTVVDGAMVQLAGSGTAADEAPARSWGWLVLGVTAVAVVTLVYTRHGRRSVARRGTLPGQLEPGPDEPA